MKQNNFLRFNKHMSLYLSETRPSQGDHHDQILEAHIKIRRTKLNIEPQTYWKR